MKDDSQEEKGWWYWPFRHLWDWVRERFAAHPRLTSAAVVVLVLLIPALFDPELRIGVAEFLGFVFAISGIAYLALSLTGMPQKWRVRSTLCVTALTAFIDRFFIQGLFLWMRIHALPLALALAVIAGVHWSFSKLHVPHRLRNTVVGLLVMLTLVGATFYPYLSLYVRYLTADVVYLNHWPETGHERVQPWRAIMSAARDARGNTQAPTEPAYVRQPDGKYDFSMAFEPIYFLSRLEGSITEVVNIPGTAGTIDFGVKNIVPVSFDIGHSLLLSHNSSSCTAKEFGPWRFVDYQPTYPMYLKDDSGKEVTVIPLIRWNGIFFPRPVFGGVEVVPQHHASALRYLREVLFGCGGYWVPADEVGKYPFLKGQDLVPEKVSRYIAQSFRFHAGFLAPMYGLHEDDIRIPTDSLTNTKEQPFIAYFHIGKGGKLYHYYGLEPYDPTKHGLAMSLFFPGDGQGPLYAYNHESRNEGLIGPSRVGSYVISSKKNFDWTHNRPAETRPFIHKICGAMRFMSITTVVTFDKDGNLTGGSIPSIAVTNDLTKTVYWVNPAASSKWQSEIAAQMAAAGRCHP